MPTPKLTPLSAQHVIAFLKTNLPSEPGVEGWQHASTTAYQFGTNALAALGQSIETKWGATPHPSPTLPDTMPRWDDISVAVLALASQNGLMTYRDAEGKIPKRTTGFIVKNAPPPPAPNIAAANGLGMAFASSQALHLLEQLGLILNGKWTSAAETVLWRTKPPVWPLNITEDPRSLAAFEQAVATISVNVKGEIRRLTRISEYQIYESRLKHETFINKQKERLSDRGLTLARPTRSHARAGIVSARRNDMDWIFFKNWRMQDGWLNQDQQQRALEIFHDPLAISMRRAVVAKLHPDLPEFAE